ncbi:hypothetical protein [Nocardia sp. NPDC003963]
MREREPAGGRGNSVALVVLWVLCLPLAWFSVHLIGDIPVRNAKVVAAGLDWAGERGDVTVLRSEEVYERDSRGGGRRTMHCYGDFAAAEGSGGFADIRVHVNGACEPGRVLPARLVRADPGNWIGGNDRDQAYAGAGWGSPLIVGLFMGVFLVLVGGIPIVGVVLLPLLFLRGKHRG